MGKATGFLEYERSTEEYAPIDVRLQNYKEFSTLPDAEGMAKQGARCMDCGIPFCHNGCPVNNLIPDWNDLVYKGDWEKAIDVLHSTNNFPEFTGRICPAPCEASCTLNIDDNPVAIKLLERSIVDKAWEQGYIKPMPAEKKTGKKVAVVGSGPAGMACAQQLARAGHEVVLFEKNDRVGGLLRYGIPDFKMEKHVIDRRMQQMAVEGVEFRVNTHVGEDIKASELMADFDAVALTGGSEAPRDLPSEGRELAGIEFAMDFLRQQNKRNAGDTVAEHDAILATGKHVVVIGGGDTGSDCIGTSNRQGATEVTQLEIMPKPPECENKALSWPNWPMKLRTSSSQEEGCGRDWSVSTKRFIGEKGVLTAIECVRVEWQQDANGRRNMVEVAGSEFEIKADLILLAMGFVNPVHEGMLEQFAMDKDNRGNVQAATDGEKAYATSVDKVFAAGDMRRGQSLVVWAIREGRDCAASISEYLSE